MRLKYLFLGLAAILLGSCSDDSDPIPELEITIDTGVQTDMKAASGGEYSIPVTCSSTWEAVSSATWVEISAESNLLKLAVSENLSRNPRSAKVTLTSADNLTQEINVEQEAYAYSESHRYKLPVVFHVLYWNANNTQHYIKEGHLQTVIDGVNKYYANCGVDINVEFVMATTAPDGSKLEEPGVNRVKWEYSTMDTSDFMSSGKSEYKNLLWNTDEYVNIVLYNFRDDAVMGIAQFPWLPAPYQLDGLSIAPQGADLNANPYPQCVCINNLYIYDMPEGDDYSMSNVAVTLSHELGHFLGLYHAFNQTLQGYTNTNEDTDYCTDTPPYNKSLYDTKLVNYLTYNGYITKKSSDGYKEYVMRTNSKTNEQFRSTNIMDYAISDADKFTPEQAKRVKYVLQHGLFIPGPKDYTGSNFTSTKGTAASGFTFTPHVIE